MAPTPGSSQGKQTKNERREAAREKARILREQEEKRAKRNRILTIVIALIAVALVAFAAWRILASDTGEMGNYDGEVRPVATSNLAEDGGILLDAQGGATTEATGAPVVGVWSDYMCGACQRFEQNNGPVMMDYAANGQLQGKLYPVDTLGWQLSTQGAAALYYTAEYAPEYVWDFNMALMEMGMQSGANGGAQPTPGDIADVAAQVGIPADVVNDMPFSIVDPSWQAITTKNVNTFRSLGYTGTPTMTVNGELDDRWIMEGGPTVLEILEEVATGNWVGGAGDAGTGEIDAGDAGTGEGGE